MMTPHRTLSNEQQLFHLRALSAKTSVGGADHFEPVITFPGVLKGTAKAAPLLHYIASRHLLRRSLTSLSALFRLMGSSAKPSAWGS